eukprot:g2098.t1
MIEALNAEEGDAAHGMLAEVQKRATRSILRLTAAFPDELAQTISRAQKEERNEEFNERCDAEEALYQLELRLQRRLLVDWADANAKDWEDKIWERVWTPAEERMIEALNAEEGDAAHGMLTEEQKGVVRCRTRRFLRALDPEMARREQERAQGRAQERAQKRARREQERAQERARREQERARREQERAHERASRPWPVGRQGLGAEQAGELARRYYQRLGF